MIDDGEFRAAYRRMIAADNLAALRAETTPCATCDHRQSAHIYNEGACRPGFACPDSCTAFVERKSRGAAT